MKRRFAKSIIIGAGFLLLAGPGLVRPSFSEVVLQDTYTTGLVLEDQANSADNQTNATIKSGASVTAETGKYAILERPTDGI
jgi:hypothetical protein